MKIPLILFLLPGLLYAQTTVPETMASRAKSTASTESGLLDVLVKGGARRVTLTKSIRLTKQVTIPASVELVPDLFGFVQGGGGSILFYGELKAGRQQIFYGFAPGEVRGTFGSESVLPEWWENPSTDKGINCAVRSGIFGGTGVLVSLAQGVYKLWSDIDLTDVAAGLQGAGMLRTKLMPMKGWKPSTWLTSNAWAVVDGGNHAGIVYVGGSKPGAHSFGTSVRGLHIDCYYASVENWDRNISGITHKVGWVEEGTVLDDICITYATGCSVGFPQHLDSATGQYAVATVNGLSVSNFWFYGGMKRTTVPVLTTQHAKARVTNGTLAFGVRKPQTSAFAEVGGGDPTIYEDPRTKAVDPHPFFTWPQVAIQAGGLCTFSDIHIEGAGIALWLPQGSGVQNVRAEGINGYQLSDAAQIYVNDGRGCTSPPLANTDYWKYGTGILISRASPSDYRPGVNAKDSFKGSFTSISGCTYLLRDAGTGDEISAFGHGQFPHTNSAALSDHVRGNTFSPGNVRIPIR
jgi:hypothetical protein